MNRQRLKDVAAVFVIICLLPYVLTILLSGSGESSHQKKNTSERTVTVTRRDCEETIPLGEYLVGVLAAQIPADYEMEALKAQAVLIRTEYFFYGGEKLQNSLSVSELKKLWGENYESNYKRLEQAVTDTGLEVMWYKQKLVKPYFHAISAGATRQGEELFTEGDYTYLRSASCEKDKQADNYVTIRSCSAKELQRILEQYYGGAGIDQLNQPESLFQDMQLDQAGYVVTLEVAGKQISGETCREQFALPSSCMQIEAWEDGVRFVCKGMGHGIGMSLYTANELAKEKKDYKEILFYFFENISIAEWVE